MISWRKEQAKGLSLIVDDDDDDDIIIIIIGFINKWLPF